MQIELHRVEFSVTYACTGRCRHCSVGGRIGSFGGHIPYEKIMGTLTRLAQTHPIESVMCFGGEPLLYPEDTCGILEEAAAAGIPVRQIITNGYFSKSPARTLAVARMLQKAGANNVLLSADGFHQERIPLEASLAFGKELVRLGVRVRVSPAWLDSAGADNPENQRTRRILGQFADAGIPSAKGNVIFPAGNAARYLSKHFTKDRLSLDIPCGQMPYTNPVDQVSCVTIDPDGAVRLCAFAIGNIYREPMEQVLSRYAPMDHPVSRALLQGGVQGLLALAGERGISPDWENCYSACAVCGDLCDQLLKDTGRSLYP